MEERPKATVLVVDDDQTSLKIITRLLETAGHQVITAKDGKEALTSLGEPLPDLIVSDWMMPEMSGLQLCREVKGNDKTSGVYFILLTAKSETQSIIQGLDEGADEYLIKPFDHKELVARVRTGLRIRALQKELVESERLAAAAQMAVTLGHKLNNLLQSISGFAQLALKTPSDNETTMTALNQIEKAAQRMSMLIRQLQQIRSTPTKSYIGGTKMLDFDSAINRRQR